MNNGDQFGWDYSNIYGIPLFTLVRIDAMINSKVVIIFGLTLIFNALLTVARGYERSAMRHQVGCVLDAGVV